MAVDLPAAPFELDPLIAEAKRRARRRRLLVAAGVVALAGLAAGLTLALRSPGGGPGGAPATADFPQFGVSLRYPAAWTQLACSEDYLIHVMPIALLTTVRPAPSCSQPMKTGVAVSWPPAAQLGENGVSVALSIASFPLPAGKRPTWNARVGARRARVTVSPPRAGVCPAGARGEYRTIAIQDGASATNAVFAVTADICGPDLAAGEAGLREVLRSIRFTY